MINNELKIEKRLQEVAQKLQPLDKIVIAQQWEKIELQNCLGMNAGYWASRDYGCFSLHLPGMDREKFKNDNEHKRLLYEGKWTEIFQTGFFLPFPVFVTESIFEQVRKTQNGRFYRRDKDEEKCVYRIIDPQYYHLDEYKI